VKLSVYYVVFMFKFNLSVVSDTTLYSSYFIFIFQKKNNINMHKMQCRFSLHLKISD